MSFPWGLYCFDRSINHHIDRNWNATIALLLNQKLKYFKFPKVSLTDVPDYTVCFLFWSHCFRCCNWRHYITMKHCRRLPERRRTVGPVRQNLGRSDMNSNVIGPIVRQNFELLIPILKSAIVKIETMMIFCSLLLQLYKFCKLICDWLPGFSIVQLWTR
jgi:hypothetical protein